MEVQSQPIILLHFEERDKYDKQMSETRNYIEEQISDSHMKPQCENQWKTDISGIREKIILTNTKYSKSSLGCSKWVSSEKSRNDFEMNRANRR